MTIGTTMPVEGKVTKVHDDGFFARRDRLNKHLAKLP